MKTKKVEMYECGYCAVAHKTKEDADYCHNDGTCLKCGVKIFKRDYYLKCKSCRDIEEQEKSKLLYEKARKMTYEEYIKEYPEHFLCLNDKYYSEFEDMEYDFDEDDFPKWTYGTTKTLVKLDSNRIISDFEESCGLEDFYLNRQEVIEIQEFCNQWNEKYAEDVYYENTNIIVLLNKEED